MMKTTIWNIGVSVRSSWRLHEMEHRLPSSSHCLKHWRAYRDTTSGVTSSELNIGVISRSNRQNNSAIMVDVGILQPSVCFSDSVRVTENTVALDDLACKQLYDYSMRAVGLEWSWFWYDDSFQVHFCPIEWKHVYDDIHTRTAQQFTLRLSSMARCMHFCLTRLNVR